jgi:hypothetical protein
MHSSSRRSSRGGKKPIDDRISMKKREYRLVEQRGTETVITDHKAFNKGPGDAAAKLAQPFFKDKNDGSKVRLTITKISDGRNQGAIYEYEIVQKHVELGKDEKVPPGIVIQKGAKKYRLKRYATKLKTYTPTMMKRGTKTDPVVPVVPKNTATRKSVSAIELDKLLNEADKEGKGRYSKNTSRKSKTSTPLEKKKTRTSKSKEASSIKANVLENRRPLDD